MNCIELGNGEKAIHKGGNDGGAPTTFGIKTGLVTSVDWKHGTRIDRYSCLYPLHSCSPNRFQNKDEKLVSIIHCSCIDGHIYAISDCLFFSAG
jgi:hypothetical protein